MNMLKLEWALNVILMVSVIISCVSHYKEDIVTLILFSIFSMLVFIMIVILRKHRIRCKENTENEPSRFNRRKINEQSP